MATIASAKPLKKTGGAAAAEMTVARIIARNPIRLNSDPRAKPAAPSTAIALAHAIRIPVAGLTAVSRSGKRSARSRHRTRPRGRPEKSRPGPRFQRRRQIEIMRPRKRHASREDQRNRQKRQSEKHGKSRTIVIAQKQNPADGQRLNHGTGLIERLVKAKAPAEPGPAGGVRQHRIARRRVGPLGPIRSAMISTTAICQLPEGSRSGAAKRFKR